MRGKPIAAVDGPDEVTKDTGATLLARYTGTVFFEPVMLHLMSLMSNVDTVEASRCRDGRLLAEDRPPIVGNAIT